MRLLVAVLAGLLLLIQWPLWFGKGGWLRVAEIQKQLDTQRAGNAHLAARNAALGAELDSLKQGREAIEERARTDLNMLRGDEVFFQHSAPVRPAPAGGARAVDARSTGASLEAVR
jgi:cell division protein FtsB